MNNRMPQYLHLPLQVLWFDTEELMLIVFIYLFSITFGIYAAVAGAVCLFYYMRAKRNKPRGFLRHLLYRAGIYELNGYPSAFAKRFRE